MRDQTGRRGKEFTATLCWDLRKFYETMDHDRLRSQAARHGSPQTLVNVALNAYRMARIVTYEDQAAMEAFPDRGIVAGDSLSDVLVKLYYLEPFCTFAAIHGNVDLHVFFDDIQLAARGPRRLVLRSLKAAAKTLKEFIQEDMKAVLAIDKASVTATCPKLAELVREGIGAEAGPPVRVAQFLGVDSLLGRRRRVGQEIQAKPPAHRSGGEERPAEKACKGNFRRGRQDLLSRSATRGGVRLRRVRPVQHRARQVAVGGACLYAPSHAREV